MTYDEFEDAYVAAIDKAISRELERMKKERVNELVKRLNGEPGK